MVGSKKWLVRRINADGSGDRIYLAGFILVKRARGRRDEEGGGGGGRDAGVVTGNASGRGRVALFLIGPHFGQRIGIGVAFGALVAVVAFQQTFVMANWIKNFKNLNKI